MTERPDREDGGRPVRESETLELGDIIDTRAIQALMDDFYRLTNIGVGMVDLKGRVLVATGWQDICTRFHRVHPEARKNCIQSDLELSAGVEPGTFKAYRCKNNLWDIATPIVIGGEHVGNLFLGQFFYEDETPDYDTFRDQARRYGFAENTYMAAVDRVPRWSRDTVDTVMSFYSRLTRLISTLSHGNRKLTRALEARDRAERALQESELKYRALVEHAQDAIYVLQDGLVRFANATASSITGYTEEEILGKHFASFLHPEDRSAIEQRYRDRLAGKDVPTNYDLRILTQSGGQVWLQINQVVIEWEGRPATLNIARDVSGQRRAERALQESEKKFRELVELSPDLIAVHCEGRFVFVNEAGLDLLGASDPAQVIGKSVTDFVQPAARQTARERMARLLERGERSELLEQKLVRLDGVERDVEVLGTPFLYEGREAVQIIAHDITDRKRAENALRESEKRFRSLFEAAPVSILATYEGKYTLANPASARLLGYESPDELVGLDALETIAPEHRDVIRERMANVEENRENATIEIPLLRPDGGHAWSLSTSVPIELEGRPSALIIGQDITQQKWAERERERLLSAIEQVAEAIIITDPEGAIQYVNPAFEEVTGYGADEVRGQNPRILKSGKQEDPFYRELWQTITSGETWQGRMVNKRKDGTLYTEDATISPVVDAAGSITNFVAVKRDVTAEIDLETRLARAQKMEAIGTLAGGIAHDFNNILSAILGFTEMVAADLPEGSRNREDLDEVITACSRARDLVKQILAFSRRSEHEARPLRIDLVVNEALKMLRSSLPSSIEMNKLIKPGLPTVLADPTQIHQIVMNLCANAAQAMENEHGTIEVALDDLLVDEDTAGKPGDLPPGSYVRLGIRDSGKGMPPEICDRIFEPYFTTKKPGEGTGLGLAVVYGIVKGLGGDVSVESRIGRGTTFRIYVPAAGKQEESTRPTAGQAPLPAGTERILFVDDEPPIVKLGAKYLRRVGYEVTTRQSSKEALELFQSDPRRFDLIITDMTMPHMTGDELAAELLSIRSDIPVVLCTGYSRRITEVKARELGIRAYVMKPLTQHELATKVREVLDEAQNLKG